MTKRIVDYKYFLVNDDGSIASGWEFKSDAEDAKSDFYQKVKHLKSLDKNALFTFLTLNCLKLETK